MINKSLKFASSLSYMTRRLRLWILLIRLFAVLLQYIEVKGQYIKVDIMQASDSCFACSNDINLCILAKAHKRLLVVLHKFSICVLNDSLSSIVIPSRLKTYHDFLFCCSILWNCYAQ